MKRLVPMLAVLVLAGGGQPAVALAQQDKLDGVEELWEEYPLDPEPQGAGGQAAEPRQTPSATATPARNAAPSPIGDGDGGMGTLELITLVALAATAGAAALRFAQHAARTKPPVRDGVVAATPDAEKTAIVAAKRKAAKPAVAKRPRTPKPTIAATPPEAAKPPAAADVAPPRAEPALPVPPAERAVDRDVKRAEPAKARRDRTRPVPADRDRARPGPAERDRAKTRRAAPDEGKSAPAKPGRFESGAGPAKQQREPRRRFEPSREAAEQVPVGAPAEPPAVVECSIVLERSGDVRRFAAVLPDGRVLGRSAPFQGADPGALRSSPEAQAAVRALTSALKTRGWEPVPGTSRMRRTDG